MGHDVFVSYHKASSLAVVKRVVNTLEDQGVRCWYAPRDAAGNYAGKITQAIENSTVFLVILNKAASRSKNVLTEMHLAFERDEVEMLPFHIADDDISDEARYYLGRFHWVDGRDDLDEGIQELTDRVLRLLGMEKQAVQKKPPVKEQEGYLTVSYCGQEHQVKAQTIHFKDGTVYRGEVVNGKRQGKGIQTMKSGDKYEGEFVNGKYKGLGKYTWKSGSVYEGEFSDDDLNGKGKYVYQNKEVYEGEFSAGVKNGKGKYTWLNGTVYEGDFLNGRMNGKGIMRWSDGSKYEGDWLEEKRTGFGTYTPANGEVLVGRFEDGTYMGKK